MQQISLERSSLAQTAVVSLVTLASLVLLGFVLAYWTWMWLAPRTEPRLESSADPAGRVASANALFGTVQRDQNLAAPTGIAIKLHGVMAAPNGKPGGNLGYAVVQLDGKQILAAREGEDISPGVRLVEVHRDHVILERNGIRETLALPEKSTAAVPSTPPINKFELPSLSGGASKKD